ncbi:MAG: patatin-like phospholipase family protein [Alphaproteobacteria bacterium]|nr:patatin-like phospholipase family protein [Alphaproteobacteria bacterium]
MQGERRAPEPSILIEPSPFELDVVRDVLGLGDLDPAQWDVVAARLQRVWLAAGETLVRQGDVGDALYVVLAGQLLVLVDDAPIGRLGARQVVGELALLARRPRSATVRARRDTVLYRLSIDAYEALAPHAPGLVRALVTVAAERASPRRERGPLAPVCQVFAVAALDDSACTRGAVDALVAAFGVLGDTAVLDAGWHDEAAGREGGLTPQLASVEQAHELVVRRCAPDAPRWNPRAVRDADALVLVVAATEDPTPGAWERTLRAYATRPEATVDLVLVHPAGARHARGTSAWLDARPNVRHHHLRTGSASDALRAARRMSGRATGLALGGGGTRGIAHLGVAQACDDVGLTVDALAGTSAGAAMAMAVALHPTLEARLEVCARTFFAVRPSWRTAGPPLVSLMSGAALDDVLRAACAGLDLEDLFLPVVCAAADLARGERVWIDRGPAWRALRASASLPGIWPPVCDGDRVLVDGGVLDNLPVDALQPWCAHGLVVGVDIEGRPDGGRYAAFTDLSPYGTAVSGWQALWQAWTPRKGAKRLPALLDILTQTMTLANVQRRRDRPSAANVHVLELALPNPGVFGVDVAAGRALVQQARERALPTLRTLATAQA